jgi:predicted esterase
MSDDRFRTFRDKMFRLYGERRYAEALAHVEQGASQFPEQWTDTVYWRGCLAARSGDIPRSLRILNDAAGKGWWWSETALRQDADLEPLQKLPEFEQLLALCRERHAAAQASSHPRLRIIQPQTGAPPHPILLALHGAGGNTEEFASHWQPAAAHGWLVGVPQSSQMSAPTRFDWRDLQTATQEILEHYNTMLKRYPADAKRTVLAGFSQGGRTAIWMTLSGILPARGFLGIACALPDDEIRKLLRDREPKHRGHLMVGTRDYGYEQTIAMADMLGSYSIPVKVDTIEGLAHEIPQDFDLRLPRALKSLLS